MKQTVKRDELDYAGSQFGFIFHPLHGDPKGCFALYSEDDENWHFVTSFNRFWIPDLEKTLDEMQKKLDKGGKP